MEIVIDDREFRNKKSKNAMMVLYNILTRSRKNVKVERISIGDLISGNIVIERKTVSDLLSTLNGDKKGNNRLFNQLRNLQKYDNPYLLVEDYYRTIFDYSSNCIYLYMFDKPSKNGSHLFFMKKVRMNPKAIENLLTVIEEQGIKIIKGAGPKDSAEKILSILYPKDRTKRKNVPTIRKKRDFKDDKEWKKFFLSGLPDINTKKSDMILSYYNYKVLDALNDIDGWINIKNIGVKTVQRVKDLLL